MVDDAGTLINMETRNTYDYMEDIVDLLNEKEERIKELEQANKQLKDTYEQYIYFLKQYGDGGNE